MASISNAITGILQGAATSMVKLADGSVVSLAQYQVQFDAADPGNEPQIVGILSGSEKSMVQLSDGSLISAAEFVYQTQEGSSLEIAAAPQGAYGAIVQTAAGIERLADLYNVPAAPAS